MLLCIFFLFNSVFQLRNSYLRYGLKFLMILKIEILAIRTNLSYIDTDY